MTFPAYPEYKDSGVEWLGEVPVHWDIQKIAWHVPFSVGWTPSSGKDEYYDGDNLWVTIADLNASNVSDTKSKISDLAVKERGGTLVAAGSMLFSFKLTVGSVAFLEKPAYTNEAIAAFEPNSNLDLRYWSYVAPIFIPKFGRNNIYGALLLNQELISSVRYYAPRLKEQQLIAAFLDHETARIDALVEEQQRLIELLKEKRQAVISHAVTKGLDPDVPMKDSGVEWLGEVPAHWEVARVKHAAKLESGHTPNKEHPEYWGGGIPWVSLNDSKQLAKVDYISETKFTVSELGVKNSSARHLPEGAVVFTRDATIGLAAITARAMTVSQHLIAWICRKSIVTPEYLLLVFYAMADELDRYTFGATIKTIGMPDVRSLTMPLPPLSEQKKVADFVFSRRDKLDRLIAEASEASRLLTERRSALISAAVTGKIDVRGWAPPSDVAPAKQEPRMEAV